MIVDTDKLSPEELLEYAKKFTKQAEELAKPRFPIQTKFYSRSDKESNWDNQEELKLTDEQMENFAYTGYEIEFDIFIDESGTAFATKVNGVELVEPVEI